MPGANVTVEPIRRSDAPTVGGYLQRTLNGRVSAEAWGAVIVPPWSDGPSNSGFQLIRDREIVGAYLAVYSTRLIEGEQRRVCNLAAFCVDEDVRAHALRLVRALLSQSGCDFTDLSPSGNVIALNERLGFRRLDTSTRLSINSAAPRSARATVTDDDDQIRRTVHGADADIFEDHSKAAAARHLVVEEGGSYAYLMYRRDRRKRMPLFASPLYVGGDRECLRAAWPSVSHFLFRRGLLATLAERRVLGFTPAGAGLELRHPRTKMFKSATLTEDSVDYLYSELTLLQW